MTDTLIDRADSGEIPSAETLVIVHPQPYLSTVDTERIAIGDATQNLAEYVMTAPFPPIRRPDAQPGTAHDTGEVPLLGPTGAEVVVAGRPAYFTPGVEGLFVAALTSPDGPSVPPRPMPSPNPPPVPVGADKVLAEIVATHSGPRVVHDVLKRGEQRRRQRAAVVRERWTNALIAAAVSFLPTGIVLLWAVTR